MLFLCYILIDEGRVNFESLKQVTIPGDSNLNNDRPESRVQITEIDTSKVVSE